jgi:hypothetical protein
VTPGGIVTVPLRVVLVAIGFVAVGLSVKRHFHVAVVVVHVAGEVFEVCTVEASSVVDGTVDDGTAVVADGAATSRGAGWRCDSTAGTTRTPTTATHKPATPTPGASRATCRHRWCSIGTAPPCCAAHPAPRTIPS